MVAARGGRSVILLIFLLHLYFTQLFQILSCLLVRPTYKSPEDENKNSYPRDYFNIDFSHKRIKAKKEILA